MVMAIGPGFDVVRLCTERLFPVCSPKLVSGHNRITKAADLLKFPLLRLDDWKTWSRWFDAAGVTDDVSLRMSKTYWIVCPKATSALPKITIFREWLLAEAADDMRRLKTLHSSMIQNG